MVKMLIKRSHVSGHVPDPSNLLLGELAINTVDGLLFFRDPDNRIRTIGSNISLKTINGEIVTGTGNIVTATPADLLTKADTVHTHAVDDITETPQKSFISSTEKDTITASKVELLSQAQRIADVETALTNVSSKDEKVKLTATDTDSKYLSELLDGTTFTIRNSKIITSSIDGLTVNTDELNALEGITGNVQQQINSLSTVGTFKDAVQTHQEMMDIDVSALSNGDIIVVLDDETRDNKSTLYIFDGGDWIYIGNFKGGEIRDFELRPLSLSTETKDILPLTKMEIPPASLINIDDTDNLFEATNVESALKELFTYANNIKGTVASAIGSPLLPTDTTTQLASKILSLKQELATALANKGIFAYSSENISSMAEKIDRIKTVAVEGIFKTMPVNITTVPQHVQVPLSASIDKTEVTTTLFVRGAASANQTIIDEKFASGDEIKYESNGRLIFGNNVTVKTTYSTNTREVTYSGLGRVFVTDLNTTDSINKILVEVS